MDLLLPCFILTSTSRSASPPVLFILYVYFNFVFSLKQRTNICVLPYLQFVLQFSTSSNKLSCIILLMLQPCVGFGLQYSRQSLTSVLSYFSLVTKLVSVLSITQFLQRYESVILPQFFTIPGEQGILLLGLPYPKGFGFQNAVDSSLHFF